MNRGVEVSSLNKENVTKEKNNFSKLVMYLEHLLKETGNNKMRLEEQCEDAFNILQPFKMETKSKNNEECLMNSGSDQYGIEEFKCDEDIDEATTEHIDEVIEKGRIVRNQLRLAQEKEKNRSNEANSKVSKSSSDSVQCISQNSQKCKSFLNVTTTKCSKNNPKVQNTKETASTPSTSVTKNKSLKKYKSPYSSPHFQTSYQKHFSVVAKNLIKSKIKTEYKDNTTQTKNEHVSENTKTVLESFEDGSRQISSNKKEHDGRKSKSLSKHSNDFKIWDEDYEDSELKCVEETINILGIPSDVVYVLKLYHQYLKGNKSSNGNKEVAYKSRFIEQFDALNNEHSDNISESEALLRQQINKYLDLFRSFDRRDKGLPEGNEPMYTSYDSVKNLKILEEKHLKLQKLKMQLNLNNIMLKELKDADVDPSQVVSVYKTLTALSDLTTLAVPIIIKND